MFPAIRARSGWPPDPTGRYAQLWANVMRQLDSNDLDTVFGSALTTLQGGLLKPDSTATADEIRRRIKTAAILLRCVFGGAQSDMVLDTLLPRVLLAREGWQDNLARAIGSWFAMTQGPVGFGSCLTQADGMIGCLGKALTVWSTTHFIEHASVARHRCTPEPVEDLTSKSSLCSSCSASLVSRRRIPNSSSSHTE